METRFDWGGKNKLKEQQKKDAENAEQQVINLANTYSRCFSTEDGKRVLEHLSNLYIFNSNVDLTSTNINYEAAYKNGEAGLVKVIIKQMTIAANL